MKHLLSIIALCLLSSFLAAQGIGGKAGIGGEGGGGGGVSRGGGTVICGTNGTVDANVGSLNTNVNLTNCTTGSDASGYKVQSLNLTVHTAGGTVYPAIYSDVAAGCGGGLTHCAQNLICGDTVGITATGGDVTNTDTATAVTTSCGTIAANTNIWFGVITSASAVAIDTTQTGCPAFGNGSEYVSGTPGSWANPVSIGAANSGGTHCMSMWAVLQPQ